MTQLCPGDESTSAGETSIETAVGLVQMLHFGAVERDRPDSKRRGKFPGTEASAGTVLTNLHLPSAVTVRDRAPLSPPATSRVARFALLLVAPLSRFPCLHDSGVVFGSLWRRELSSLNRRGSY